MKSITPHAAMLAGSHGVGPRFRAMQVYSSDEEFDVVLATQGETREQQRLASSHGAPTSVAEPNWCPPSRCFFHHLRRRLWATMWDTNRCSNMHALIWMERDGMTSGSMACEMENVRLVRF